MSTRPRRATTSQKDASNDMLGLSRQEERMLQRAMYDSLRHQSKLKSSPVGKSKLQRKSMTTRSMAVTRRSVTLPNPVVVVDLAERPNHSSSADDFKVEQEIKRGTRYSPMRKGPLSEMLKSLENKKTQIDIPPSMVLLKPLSKRNIQVLKKDDPTKEVDVSISVRSPKVVIENMDLKRSSRSPKISRSDNKRPRISSTKSRSPLQVSTKSSNKKTNQRTPRHASLVARAFWLSQVNELPSPNKSQSKASVSTTTSPSDVKLYKSNSSLDAKVSKPMIYNQKAISRTQRMSRNILATAAKRVKKAKLKSKVVESSRRNSSKARTNKEAESQSSVIIPPELWLDPKGQPVETQDFINFLLYRDTPYLEPSLKWFNLPPHRRKQRFYKVIQSEPGMKFNETVVYTEKKEGGGKEVVVHCIPPKLIDEGSELVSSTSDRSSNRGDNKRKVAPSCASSCHTHAAVDDEPLIIVPDIADVTQSIAKSSPGPGRPKSVPVKVSPHYEYRSKHIMQTRHRGT